MGRIPAVELEDGRRLAESNAIIRYLGARQSRCCPTTPFAQAKIDEWLFWEQYSHEPYIAVVPLSTSSISSRAERCARSLARGARRGSARSRWSARSPDGSWLVGEP